MTRLVLLIGCVVPLAACQYYSVGNDLDVTVNVRPTGFQPGLDTAFITVAAHNRSDQQVTVRGSGSCILRYEISRLSGERVYDAGFCTDDLSVFQIAPGDSLARTFQWTGEVWEMVAFEFRSKVLESGAYRIAGVLKAEDRQERSGFVEIQLMPPR